MPTAHVDWWWEEAFDRNGFGDGDGLVMTDDVKDFITKQGYSVDAEAMKIHNRIIVAVMDKNGKEWCPDGFCGETTEYKYSEYGQILATMPTPSPREFLPSELVTALDEQFPSDEPYDW